jgi:hypothetical protein
MTSLFRSTITAFNLDDFVSPPEPDTVPRRSFDTGYYTISFKWFDDTDNPAGGTDIAAPDKFEPDRIYRAVTSLSPNSGFIFEDPYKDAGKFTWGTGEKSPNIGKGSITSSEADGNDVKVVITFAKTGKIKINLVDLRAVLAPEDGAEPVTSIPPGTGYSASGGIAWSEISEAGEGGPVTGTFADGRNYTAAITFAAEARYSFEGLTPAGIVHFGKEASLDPATPPEECDRVTVTVAFHPAGSVVRNDNGEGSPEPEPAIEREWYVKSVGNNTAEGGRTEPLATVEEALARAAAVYAETPVGASWTIIVMDEVAINGTVTIDGDVGYPPIVLRDDSLSPGGKLLATTAIGEGEDLLKLKNGAKAVLDGGLILEGLGPESGTKVRGVYVDARSKFTMKGGEITGHSAGNNRGGGVYVENGGTFIMEGGEITGNTAPRGGGVYAGGYLIMSGGKITGNSGGAGELGEFNMMGYGIGVYVNGSFTMSGGEISDNHGLFSVQVSLGNVTSGRGYGAGVYVHDEAYFTMEGGRISGNSFYDFTDSYGGGVYTEGSFTMSGGEISGNFGSVNGSCFGGGVCVKGRFTMSGGKISLNRATVNNSGPYVYGGGVCVYDDDGIFTMSGGEISGNAAVGDLARSGGFGGGVCAYHGTFIMEGGIISGNYAYRGGGGVWLNNASFAKTGGTVYGHWQDRYNAIVKDQNSNSVTISIEGNGYGHAIYVLSFYKKDATVGPDDVLYYNFPGHADFGWD